MGRLFQTIPLWQQTKSEGAQVGAQASLPADSTVKAGRFGIGVTKPNSEFQSDDERRGWMQQTMLAFLAALTLRLKV